VNVRYSNPEVISKIRTINQDGDDIDISDKVCGFGVVIHDARKVPILQLDIRDFTKGKNLIVEIELSEAIQAISLATLNRDS
jgi:hypothetical protein